MKHEAGKVFIMFHASCFMLLDIMKKYLALLIILAVILSACGGRVPKPSRSQKIIKKYFKKYAKKYPDTIYGRHKVIEVEVEKQDEIRKNYASIETYLKLGNGTLKKIHATLRKNLLGWRFLSWEDDTGS